MAPRFALIHSPFVGPSCWRGVERALVAAGGSAVAVDYGGVTGPDWYVEAPKRIARIFGSGKAAAILVAHSGAGVLVPAIVQAADRLPTAIVFADATLPHPGRSWFETAPEPLTRRLRDLATDGMLPPWNRWFDYDPTVRLLTDVQARAAFVADLPRVPMAFFEAPAPRLTRWEHAPAHYLQLSEAYGDEASEAARRGWGVRREALHHLAMIAEPDRLATILVEMAMTLGLT